MHIIIVGGGKVGFDLATLLLAEGNKVLLIEKDEIKAAELAIEFGAVIQQGNGSCVRTLKDGEADRADVLVALTGTDEANLVICQVAKSVFNCRKTIAGVNNPKNISIFSSLGIDVPVSTTRLISSLIQEQVKGEK